MAGVPLPLQLLSVYALNGGALAGGINLSTTLGGITDYRFIPLSKRYALVLFRHHP
ncbi:hypothetical protein KCP74_08425 [Salmonella enterica subsp. enterica]|nr:hypothetical protein KCP74_08425 [Salmonella enterica subsp. enterica]